MNNQITFLDVPKSNKTKNLKQKWRNKLQEYCDKEAISDENECNAWCKCGYMSYCDYCLGAGETNACVKAICEFCKKKKIEIDYNNFDFESFLEKVEKIDV